MIFSNPYWSTRTKLDLLARWLIVHSIIYYEIGTSIVEDIAWNNNAQQFVELAAIDPEKSSQIRWWYVMNDFDSSTGFLLFSKLRKKDKAMLLHTARGLVYNYGDASMVIDKRKIKKPRRQIK